MKTKLLFALGPYIVTSAFFFTVTQISHVQAAVPAAGPDEGLLPAPGEDVAGLWLHVRAPGAYDGRLERQSIHHVMPVVAAATTRQARESLTALCEKRMTAPATEPNIFMLAIATQPSPPPGAAVSGGRTGLMIGSGDYAMHHLADGVVFVSGGTTRDVPGFFAYLR